MESYESFSIILKEAMESYGVGCKRLEELLVDQGVENITYKRISEYVNANHTPSFQKAKLILSALEFPIDDADLEAALERNRQIIKDGNSMSGVYNSNRELHTTIRIKLRRLIPGQSPDENERFLRERIFELFGKEKGLSDYVQWLINKDLEESIISREEIHADEN